MTLRNIRRTTRHDETIVSIPAFLRDKFRLQEGDTVEFDVEDSKIIIIPKKRRAKT